MESEAFIKIEEESPAESTSNLLNLCMAHFYDDDSADPICLVKEEPFNETAYDNHQVYNSFIKVMDDVEQMLDMRTTPLE